jgi:hypothetical protein
MTAAKALSFLRRGLSRVDSAAYVGVGPTKFDAMVSDGRMPPPRRIDGRRVWDVVEIDSCFDNLPHETVVSGNSWDDR